MTDRDRIPRVLSIAGSDSGGGAGIQADLKAFAACGAHGMTAITAITAQNTVGVTDVHVIPPEMILAQVRAVSADIGVDAVKIGMLGNVATIEAVAEALDELPEGTPVVLDPVMVAESGAAAARADGAGRADRAVACRARLWSRRTCRRPGARRSGAHRLADGGAKWRCRSVRARGDRAGGPRARPAIVVVTGGHREQAIDVFFDGDRD